MQLNLPIFDQLKDCWNILVAGAGGGFDVFSGLPIYFTLKELGKTVHLANLSFTDLSLVAALSQADPLVDDVLVGTSGEVRGSQHLYFPEPLLAQWFQEEGDETITIWLFGRIGAAPYIDAYHKLAERLDLDAVVLVDGGVDSIMRGDEEGPGTLIEDTLSLIAVDALAVPVKILACIGFGTEIEEGLCHYCALENMAALTKASAFLGSCALTQPMDVFQRFERACRYVWEQPNHQASHISTRIIPAVHGEFGDYHLYPDDRRPTQLFISPLMSLYWFFDVGPVVQRNTLVSALRDTQTRDEAMRNTLEAIARRDRTRPRRAIPY